MYGIIYDRPMDPFWGKKTHHGGKIHSEIPRTHPFTFIDGATFEDMFPPARFRGVTRLTFQRLQGGPTTSYQCYYYTYRGYNL